MSETSIIPAQLRDLLLWRTNHNDVRTRLIERFMASSLRAEEVNRAAEIMPLDFEDLRKTQRRVAALLGQPGQLSPGTGWKPKHSELPTVCSVGLSTRFTTHRFSEKRLKRAKDIKIKSHVTFSPPMHVGIRYSQGQLYGSCSQLVDVLNGTYDGAGSKTNAVLPPIRQKIDALEDDKSNVTFDIEEQVPILPPIEPSMSKDNQGGNSMDSGLDDRSIDQQVIPAKETNVEEFAQDLISALGAQMLLRAHTLESERTGGSLRIDEDYVPMSVTVRKVANMDMEKSGESPYQEFTEFFSRSSSSVGHNQEEGEFFDIQEKFTTLDAPEIKPLARYYSSDHNPHEHTRRDSRDRPGVKLQSDPKILTTDPTSNGRSGSGQRTVPLGQSREVSAIDLLVATPLGHKSPTISRERNNGVTARRDKGRTNESIHSRQGNPAVPRVRFAETTQQKLIPILDNRHKHNSNNEPSNSNAYVTKRKERKKAREIGGPENKISPDIHKKAYLLAISDAHSAPEGKTKQKQRKKKGHKLAPEQGLIFSYFPLLKRPYNVMTDVNPLALGLRQDPGTKVRLKDAMKHVLGKMKLGDYYPSGKKYRPLS